MTDAAKHSPMRQSLASVARAGLLVLACAALPTVAVAQQNLFAPRILVDDKAITTYEYNQRFAFMRLLNAPGDLAAEAERTLIEDRLRLIAAEREKIRLTPQQIEAGMAEFAARFEMELDQFITILEANGVASQTFRDFVQAGVAWREVLLRRFGPTAMDSVLEPEVDLVLSVMSQAGVVRVQLSELVLGPNDAWRAEELAQTLRGEGAFANAVRSYSIGEGRETGGRQDWRNAATLPPQVLAAIDALGPGQISAPVRLANGNIALYLVRQIDTRERPDASVTAIDHAILRLGPANLPATQAELARLRARVDTCNDLNVISGSLTRETTVQRALPTDLARRLDALDDREMAEYVDSAGNQVVLMLCSRRIASSTEDDRTAARGRVADRKVAQQAELYLDQLRSNAHIRRP